MYGGASAVGAFALKFARLSGCNPIITVAGKGIPFVQGLGIADAVVDYRAGDVAGKIREALGGRKLYYAFDAISGRTSFGDCLAVLERDGGARLNMLDLLGWCLGRRGRWRAWFIRILLRAVLIGSRIRVDRKLRRSGMGILRS